MGQFVLGGKKTYTREEHTRRRGEVLRDSALMSVTMMDHVEGMDP